MQNKIKIILFVLIAFYSMNGIAKETSYIRDYSYQASDTDSKVSARKSALLFLKEKLLSEIGTIVGSNVNIFRSSNGVNISSQKIQSLTEGLIKTEVIEEKWNGVTFYVKARLLADPDKITDKLKAIAAASKDNGKNNEEFDYWKSVVQIDSNESYLNYMTKYPDGKYQELAEIAIVRLLKEKMHKQKSNKWLTKPESKVLIVSRHDTGTVNDIDADEMTMQMANTIRKGLSNYLPKNVKIQIVTDFDQTEDYFFEYKNISKSICQKQEADLIVGAILEDHEGFQGGIRPVKMFIRNCGKNALKHSRFVPRGGSNEEFWRKNDIQKKLRVLIQDYFDTI